ncbi:MAG: hypothetical protein M3440_09850 [Chloroflexota bacterium]|nr:hypothetical protein [Chloroflexota bacterium]
MEYDAIAIEGDIDWPELHATEDGGSMSFFGGWAAHQKKVQHTCAGGRWKGVDSSG